MNIQKLKKALKTSVFTHEEIANLLKNEVSNINAKISYMVKQEILIRLKKGLYVFSELYRDSSVDIISIANRLYTPSYISFDYALSYYGLIPERVYEVTSATLHAKKVFDLAVYESCDWQEKEGVSFEQEITEGLVLQLLKNRIESLDIKSAKRDIEPFILDGRVLDIWSKEFFLLLVYELRFTLH